MPEATLEKLFRMKQKLLSLSTSAEFTVVLLEDMTGNSTYHQFARTLFDDWGKLRSMTNRPTDHAFGH